MGAPSVLIMVLIGGGDGAISVSVCYSAVWTPPSQSKLLARFL